MTLLLLIAVKGALVLTLGVFASQVLRRAPASVRHSVWAATFLALLLVPALDAFGPNWDVAVPVHVDRSSDSPPAFLSEGPSAFLPVGPAGPWAGLAAVLGGAWALGTVVVASVWLLAFARARQLVRDAEPVADSTWAEIAERARPRHARLLRSDALRVPIAWGYGRPAVVLPPYADEWDHERREAVLRHELAHLRRRDAWTQAIAQAALALHWPNPLVWLAYRRFLDTCEQACDDAVLSRGTTATDYAAHLVAIARELNPSRLTVAAVLPMTGRGELEVRVRSILDGKRLRTPLGRRYLGATLAVVIVIGGPLAAFHPAPIVTVCVREEDGGRPEHATTQPRE